MPQAGAARQQDVPLCACVFVAVVQVQQVLLVHAQHEVGVALEARGKGPAARIGCAAAHELHTQMNCICYENPKMGIYFIADPDGYWLEIVPTRK